MNLWGRKYSINKLESHLSYWNEKDNFEEIIKFIKGDRFTHCVPLFMIKRYF